jgi:UTP--glucose-1-phosphate uridylyltransferase
MSIKKAVIPAAGWGTKFLPATKAVPKELLPVVDIPTIQYIVEEVVESGIEDIIFVVGPGKNAILDHFDPSPRFENLPGEAGKKNALSRLNELRERSNIVSVRQHEPKGLGDAVLCAKDLIGDEAFVVLLGDDLVDSAIPCIRQMIDVYEKHGNSVVALSRVNEDEVDQFGICGGHALGDRIYNLDTMVEKPSIQDAPSHLAIVGRYLFKPSIFKYLEEVRPSDGKEHELTSAMARMMKIEGFTGYEFTGERYDAGEKFGLIQANIAFGLKRRDLRSKLKAYLRDILEQV